MKNLFTVFLTRSDLALGAEGDRFQAEFLADSGGIYGDDPRVRVYGDNGQSVILTLGDEVQRPWNPKIGHDPYDFSA